MAKRGSSRSALQCFYAIIFLRLCLSGDNMKLMVSIRAKVLRLRGASLMVTLKLRI